MEANFMSSKSWLILNSINSTIVLFKLALVPLALSTLVFTNSHIGVPLMCLLLITIILGVGPHEVLSRNSFWLF
jgi:hypothetical protein